MNIFKFDTHMHFDLYSNREKALRYIENEKSYTIAVTNLPKLYERYFNLNTQYKYVRCALGFHPELAFQYKEQMGTFSKYIATTRFIGEVGLDYTTKDVNNRKAQEMIFSHIVRECNNKGNKILSIHSRKAEKRVLEILDGLSACVVILHWYSGSLALLDEAIEKGYYLSVNQQMIRSKSGRRIVDYIPKDKILIESDAPFTNGLKAKYSIDFMNDIYEYICRSKGITDIELSFQLKSNFKEILTKYL